MGGVRFRASKGGIGIERKPDTETAAKTSGDDLLCKTGPLWHLRAGAPTSTIILFSLASFPRRPSAPQAVPGGAMDPTTDNRYAKFIFFRYTSLLHREHLITIAFKIASRPDSQSRHGEVSHAALSAFAKR